jgi:hypothetical protein
VPAVKMLSYTSSQLRLFLSLIPTLQYFGLDNSKAALGGVKCVAYYIISHEQTMELSSIYLVSLDAHAYSRLLAAYGHLN